MSNNNKSVSQYVGDKVEEVQSSPWHIFPQDLYVLTNGDNVHGIYTINCPEMGKITGLVVFSYKSAIQVFLDFLTTTGGTGGVDTIEEVPFDEAREIAKTKEDYIICLLLCDDLEDVKIHYIR